MKRHMKKIGEFEPLLFEDHLILSLDKKWLEVFGEMPKFEVKINNSGKLQITSTKSIPYTKSTKWL